MVEVFGDIGVIDPNGWRVAMPHTTRVLRLVDLRGRGAMRAGCVAAVAKTPERGISQAWARWFYDRPEYDQADGIACLGAHNDDESFMLFERAEQSLSCGPQDEAELCHSLFRPALLEIAEQHNLVCSL